MRVVSVNVGSPEILNWHGRPIRTAFRKRRVAHRLAVGGVNIAGDDQADRAVHGGPRKSIYVYPSEHYAYWKQLLQLSELPWGSFGENLTTEGWLETETRLGEEYQIGSVVVVVTQPRQPCYKIDAVFGRDDMIPLFLRSRRSGFYLGIVRTGEIGVGDTIEPLDRTPNSPTVAEAGAIEE